MVYLSLIVALAFSATTEYELELCSSQIKQLAALDPGSVFTTPPPVAKVISVAQPPTIEKESIYWKYNLKFTGNTLKIYSDKKAKDPTKTFDLGSPLEDIQVREMIVYYPPSAKRYRRDIAAIRTKKGELIFLTIGEREISEPLSVNVRVKDETGKIVNKRVDVVADEAHPEPKYVESPRIEHVIPETQVSQMFFASLTTTGINPLTQNVKPVSVPVLFTVSGNTLYSYAYQNEGIKKLPEIELPFEIKKIEFAEPAFITTAEGKKVWGHTLVVKGKGLMPSQKKFITFGDPFDPNNKEPALLPYPPK